MAKTSVALLGYGNIARGAEIALSGMADMELTAVFTRRDPAGVKLRTPGVPVIAAEEAENWRDRVDVLILCGGSATDLPVQGPKYAEFFNTVDSFDTHAKIPAYRRAMEAAAGKSGHLSVISCGWDPGMFSLARLYGGAILPDGCDYTFWGRGVSQGHSDAIRRIEGVADARQYTVPLPEAVEAARSGRRPVLSSREKHRRECYVVAKPGADRAAIEKAIVTMPNYFADYDTTVTFITEEEMKRDHAGMPHGGFVIRTGNSAAGTEQKIEYSLTLGSNPEFTGAVLCAVARAAARLSAEGRKGAVTMLDIPPAYLSEKSSEELSALLL